MSERGAVERLLLERVLPWVATALVTLLIYVAMQWRSEALANELALRDAQSDIVAIKTQLSHLERKDQSRDAKVDAVHDALLAAGIIKPQRGGRR